MSSQILILKAHPDPDQGHLGHSLADAYAAGATQGGHVVRMVVLAELDIPFLRGMADWKKDLPAQLEPCRQDLLWANHVVIVTPLWLGDIPAMLKAFLEQLLRPGIATDRTKGASLNCGLLGGRSARIVMTMGMPALVYRWFFDAHALKLLKRNILHFVGIRPVRTTLVGNAAKVSPLRAEALLRQMRRLGEKGI